MYNAQEHDLSYSIVLIEQVYTLDNWTWFVDRLLGFLLMAVPMLTVGNGSLFYYSSKFTFSSQSVDEFNQRLPGVLRKIYGVSSDVEDVSDERLRFSGIFQIILGGSICIIFICGQIRDIFWYGKLVQDIIATIFVIAEILILLYLFNLGRMLAKIEQTRQDATSNNIQQTPLSTEDEPY